MIFSKLFKKKQPDWGSRRKYLKSTIDLGVLSEQIIYVEGRYDGRINRIISEKYDEISAKLKSSKLSKEFIYLPFVIGQLQRDSPSFVYILKYYFPNLNRLFDSDRQYIFNRQLLSRTTDTNTISHPFFSNLGYKDRINPGFFRYAGKDREGLFVYEYFPFSGSGESSVLKQIDYYISSISVEKEGFPFDDMLGGGKSLNIEKRKLEERETEPDIDSKGKIDIDKSLTLPEIKVMGHLDLGGMTDLYPPTKKRKSVSYPSSDDDKKKSTSCSSDVLFEEEKALGEKDYRKEHELISRIKSDIQNLKELGFYELLIKELGNSLFERSTEMFQPSRLLMNEEFRIYLPDFNNMEIVMTPLPKTLFILFLRHPEGINLKTLIDYKRELLEIYKLLSYRETYFNMVESVERICNPVEGSINEKLSRIKEAFLRKMSMDTAKHYIITGQRGMKKKIEIDRSLIELPNTFEEIERTKIVE